MIIRATVLAALLLTATPSLWAAETGLFVSGTEVKAVVLDQEATPSDKATAFILVEFVEAAAGVKLRQQAWNDDLKEETGLVLLGDAAVKAGGFTMADLAAVGEHGYRIRTANGNAYIAGGPYGGSRFGTYAFLEKMGYKFYAEDFIKSPDRGQIVLGDMDVARKPFYEARFFGTSFWSNRPELAEPREVETAHRAATEGLGGTIFWDHTAGLLVPFVQYGKEHPEYWAAEHTGARYAADYDATLEKGAKYIYRRLHLCYSNPDVRNISLGNASKWIEQADGDQKFFVISMSDGNDWCLCEKCIALDPKPGQYMDRLLTYLNPIAEEIRSKHPDKMLLTLGYHVPGTLPPPTEMKIPSNVRVMIAAYPPHVLDRGHWFDHKLNRSFLDFYTEWVERFPGQVYMYDYPSPSGKYLSLIHEQHYYRLKRYASDGIRGMYHCGKPWFMNSLFQYVVSRLGWDPSLDTDALAREFVADYYGPAAPKIMEIYTMLTQVAAREDRPQFGTKQLSFVTIPECERILSLFGEAEALAGPSGIYRDRVTGEKAFALYSYLCIRNPVLGNAQDLSAFTAHLRELLDIAINKPTNHWFVVRAGRGAKRKDAFQDFLWTVARVKVGPGMPMEDPIIAQLMKDNEFDIAKHITVVKPETLDGNKGWRIPLDLFTGAGIPKMYKWKCPPRRGIVLRTQFFDEHTMTATFDLTDDVDGKWKLMLDGQNHDKLTPGAEFAISVNGKEIFRGPNPFVRQGWSAASFEIPAGVLRQIGNTISMTDLADGDVLFSDWLIIADVRIERP